MIDFNKLFSPRNRGLLLDASTFIFQLILLRILTKLAQKFVQQASDNTWSKAAISVFLIGLFVLQPIGPVLKRWSFHQHFKSFESDETAFTGLLLSFYKFFYIGAMWIMIYLAFLYFYEAFPDYHTDRIENIVIAVSLVLPVVSGIVIFRYFQKPRSEPHLKFLMSPYSELVGDVCMFLNVICFQLLFSVYVSSPQFLNALHKITRLGDSDSSGAVGGRLYLTAIAALLAYFPPRIFYLVIDQHRKITWLMMLLANLPLIISVLSYSPTVHEHYSLKSPTYVVTATQLHDEYEAGYLVAMKKYRNQVVNISGKVQTRFFPRSLSLDDQIGLDGKDGYPWVYCSFDEEQVDAAESLEIGEQVTFQCLGSDDWSRGAGFQHCIVVRGR